MHCEHNQLWKRLAVMVTYLQFNVTQSLGAFLLPWSVESATSSSASTAAASRWCECMTVYGSSRPGEFAYCRSW